MNSRSTTQVLVEAGDGNAALVAGVTRLQLAVREVAADLALARRDCRQKQHQIERLQADSTRLLAGASVVTRRDDPGTEVPRVSDGARNLGAHRSAREQALERMSSVVLVLRRENLALKQENASLRLEAILRPSSRADEE